MSSENTDGAAENRAFDDGVGDNYTVRQRGKRVPLLLLLFFFTARLQVGRVAERRRTGQRPPFRKSASARQSGLNSRQLNFVGFHRVGSSNLLEKTIRVSL